VGVDANANEVFAAYRFPHKRWSPFLLAGAGGLLFDPGAGTGADVQARAGYMYGGGTDFEIHGRLFVRAEYRGFSIVLQRSTLMFLTAWTGSPIALSRRLGLRTSSRD
jgi:opacity protein-like surface antigen